MTEHTYGPKGHIVDAFNKHLDEMTRDDWDPIYSAWLSTSDAVTKNTADLSAGLARQAIGTMPWFHAADKARHITEYAVVKGDTDIAGQAIVRFSMYAVDEILASDLMRKHNIPFLFLPMFGFVDEQTILDVTTL